MSAAAALSAGAEVTVLEREGALGYHASGRSAAMFEENYGNAVVNALSRASRRALEAAGVLSPRGLLGVAFEDEAEVFGKDIEALGLIEVPVEEAHRRVPILSDQIVRAGIHDEAEDIDTGRLLDHFARRVTDGSGRIVKGGEVTGITRSGDAWQVTAGGETHVADVIVNAAGAWVDAIAAMAGVKPIGFQPLRRSMARLPAPGGRDLRHWPMLMGPGETWYAKPDAGAWIVSPAEEDPVQPMDAWADDMVLAEGIARYEAYVTEPVTRVIANWAGLRTFAPDRTLVIGEDPEAEGFFWMAGQGGYGFQTAPAAGALLADLVFGRTPVLETHLVAAVAPGRFR